MEINKITFDEISLLWKLLWDYEFLPKSAMIFLKKEKDLSIHKNDKIKVSFFGAFDGEKIVGVNSGFCPCDNQYRSRGLYVLPEYRKKGIANKLLNATEAQGKKENKILLWSVPRESALSIYLKYGFKKASNFFKADDGVDLKHCFVMKVIR